MMTLDEAIVHAKETAKKLRSMTSVTDGKPYNECLECAKDHEQLASWLEELKALRIANPKGEWIYPYADIKIGGRRVGKRDKECSVCHRQFSNNLPWDANFCPYCGADMRGGDVI